MTYVLRFLPIIEEDALAGYTWYEEKARGLGGEFLRLFYAVPERFHGIHCCTQRFIVNFGVGYSDDSHMPSTFG